MHGSLIVALTVSASVESRLLIEPLEESVTGDDGSPLNDLELGEIVLTHKLIGTCREMPRRPATSMTVRNMGSSSLFLYIDCFIESTSFH